MRRSAPQPDTKMELVKEFVNLLTESEQKRLTELTDKLIEENNSLNFSINNRFYHSGKVWKHSDANMQSRELATPLDFRLEDRADMLVKQHETLTKDTARIVQCLRMLVNHAASTEDWRNVLPEEFAKYFKDPIPRTRQQSEVWKLTEPQQRDYASVLLLIQKYSGLALFN